jgi:hypothetical protein
MPDKSAHDCPATQDGVCAFHNVEIERRKAVRDGVLELKKEISESEKDSSAAWKEQVLKNGIFDKFNSWVMGVGALGLLVILGSYTLTSVHKVAADARYYQTIAKIESHRSDCEDKMRAVYSDVSTNKISMAVLASQLETTNGRLKEMLDFMKEKETLRTQGVPRGG